MQLFGNDNISPWNASFHASIDIGLFHFSFVDAGLFLMSSRMERRPNNRINFDYVRFRFFDFFPLDHWVKSIANYIDKKELFLNVNK